MNKLIIFLVILVVIVMLILTYALGGFDWLFKFQLTDQTPNATIWNIEKNTW